MRVPFLMFHSVSEKSGPPGYRFAPDGFRYFLGMLRDEGIGTPTLSDYLLSRGAGDRRAAVLTFDDGWQDNLTVAFPLLEEFGCRATFFPSVSLIGKEGMMDWDDLRALSEAGMEIGSHGLSHDLLVGRPEAELWREVAESRRRLEEGLGREVAFFSLPRGCLPPSLPGLVRRAGYRGLCTSRAGSNRPAADPYRWRRYPVRAGMAPDDLRAVVRGTGARLVGIYCREKVREALRLRHRWFLP